MKKQTKQWRLGKIFQLKLIKNFFIDSFHKHLNLQKSNIHFRVERYFQLNGLAFLDTLNKVCVDGIVNMKFKFMESLHIYRQISSLKITSSTKIKC